MNKKMGQETISEQMEVLVKKLEHERALLRAVIAQAPAGIIIVEAPSGKQIIYNNEAEKILSHPVIQSEDYTDYDEYKAIHPDGTPYQAEEYPLARSLLYGEIVHQEHMRYQRSDGTLIHLSVNTAPIYDEQGNKIAAIVTLLDITTSYDLEQRKDVFIGLAGHELRTPITAMKLSLQMIERKLKKLLEDSARLGAKDLQLLEQVQREMKRSLRQVDVQRFLVNDLLDISRIQMGKLTLSLRHCNLARIVRSVVEDQRAAVPERTIHSEVLENAEIRVLADEERVIQVMNNYLTNALKYSADTEPIQVGINVEKGYARAWVKDRGPGLSQEVQQHIWEQFYQAPGAQTQQASQGANLGLGLYLCRELIERQGGQVGVESALGEGSRFWFTLPLAPPIENEPQ
ncbi:MAG TPA: ATP-binding protein [Ktedonosporobacter sp.]|nr:ATP-binding protein [Ktedonosporobacter sp.]